MSQGSEAAAAPMENLPQDIISNILSRFPVKSVLQFRCVRKSWRSLISESQFAKTHLNRAITNVNARCERVLLQCSPVMSIDYEALQNNCDSACAVLDFLARDPENDFFSISESCNGMVCIIERKNIILCNPCTRDAKELPKLSSITLINGTEAFGLGYDSTMDDYKVVIAVPAATINDGEIHNSGDIQVEVFSLRSNTWRRLPDIHRYGFERLGGTLLNGALHWLVTNGNDRLIISFDLASEKFQELLPLPPNQGDNGYFRSLNVLGGYLSIDCHELYVKHELWVMKEYGSEASWTKLFTISEDKVAFVSDYYLRPVCFLKNGDLLLDVDGSQLIFYNPKEETSRILNHPNNGYLEWDVPVVYSETLVSPNCYG